MEYKWAGDWKRADEGFTSWQNSNFFGMVGAAAHYQTGGGTFNTSQAAVPPGPPADFADVDLFGFTADVTVKGSGWNAFAAAVMTVTDPGSNSVGAIGYPGNGTGAGATASTQTDFGLIAQGGILVAPQWELFGRFDIVVPDSSRTVSGGPTLDDEMTTLTFGVNYYLCPDSHSAKFTAQLQYFLNKQTTGIAPASTPLARSRVTLLGLVSSALASSDGARPLNSLPASSTIILSRRCCAPLM